MRWLLLALSGLAFVMGGAVLLVAESAIHEIEAFILFVCAAVLLAGAATVSAIHHMTKRLPQQAAKSKYPRATPL